MSDELEPTWLRDLRLIDELCHGNAELFITERKKADHVLKYYDGDLKRYEKGAERFDRDALSWEIVQAYADYHPEHQRMVDHLLYRRLGFRPSENVAIPASIYLRKLIEDSRNRFGMTWSEFQKTVDVHIKHVRNEFMQVNGWLDHLDLTSDDREHYKNCESHLKSEAQQLIKEFLGYKPDLEHSLYAEITIRKVLAEGSWTGLQAETRSEIRCQIVTIVKYLEVLYKFGRATADQSPLHGFDWEDSIQSEVLH
ncbi:hypothetical protein [Chryseolinea sp. H1M3-3]|uniref:hypothetical protein n=1 Tax=Chryseolinea sp. H1M3-3 TaxID=3034144 RepID=UPI0023EC8D3B|nr:hypothetical protein [Chryseolinea sp. H1M3-3]